MITLSASETTDNFSYADLVEDINNAISETDANGLVHAEWDVRADRLKLVAPGQTLRVKVWSYAELGYYDTAFTELGFAMGYSGPGETVYAQRSPAIGKLTGDALFSVSMDEGESWVFVRIAASATTSNYAITDLVKDVDDALAAGGGSGGPNQGGVQPI